MPREFTYGVAGLYFNDHEWQLSFATNDGYRHTPKIPFANNEEGFKQLINHIIEKFNELQLSASRVLLLYSPPSSDRIYPPLFRAFSSVPVVYPERLVLHKKRLKRHFSNLAELLVEAAVSGLQTEQILIETSNVCTFSCLFCPQDLITRKKERMPYEVAIRIIDEYAANGIGGIGFHLMGEPTTNPDLAKLVSRVAGFKIEHTLTTNASLLTYEKSIELFKSGLKRLQISVQTFTEAQYYAYKRPAPNCTYEKVLENIKNCILAKWESAPDAEIEIHIMDTSVFQPRGVTIITSNEEAEEVLCFWIDLVKTLALETGHEEECKQASELDAFSLSKSIWPHGGCYLAPNILLTFKTAGHWLQNFLEEDEFVVLAAKGTCKNMTFGDNQLLAIQANGDAVLCCYDYDGGTKIGNINQVSLAELDKRASRARSKLLQSENIPFAICRRCLGLRVKSYNQGAWYSLENRELSFSRVVVYGTAPDSIKVMQLLKGIGVEVLAFLGEDDSSAARFVGEGNAAQVEVCSVASLPETAEAILFPPSRPPDPQGVNTISGLWPTIFLGAIDRLAFAAFVPPQTTLVANAADREKKDLAGEKEYLPQIAEVKVGDETNAQPKNVNNCSARICDDRKGKNIWGRLKDGLRRWK